MDGKSDMRIMEIFRLLDEQHKIQNQWPYTEEMLEKDHRLSERIRELCDQLCPNQRKTIGADAELKEAQVKTERRLLLCT